VAVVGPVFIATGGDFGTTCLIQPEMLVLVLGSVVVVFGATLVPGVFGNVTVGDVCVTAANVDAFLFQ
jgi:hypothetical protein